MTTKRKPTYEQALALQRGHAAARRAARERAAARQPVASVAPKVPMADEERLALMREYSTDELQFRLRKARAPEADLSAMREVLAERNVSEHSDENWSES